MCSRNVPLPYSQFDADVPRNAVRMIFSADSGKAKRVIVQVKSGHVKSCDIRDLVGTLDREGGAIGVFITIGGKTLQMQPSVENVQTSRTRFRPNRQSNDP